MNFKLIVNMMGKMLMMNAAFMTLPLAVAFIYKGSDRTAFILAVAVTCCAGILLTRVKPEDKKFRMKDAFAAAGLLWVLFSLFGALPFLFSGSFDSVIDCIFESVSGFTTTGATVLKEVASKPKGVLFWRSFSHWIGGMGFIVFMLAVLPTMNASSIHLLRAESTGPLPDRVVPRLRETARLMYLIYIVLTVLLTGYLVLAGLPLYDSLVHAFSTAGTGGFSSMNASLASYNNLAAEIGISIFMFLFGVNFSLYFFALKGGIKQMLHDEELRLYVAIVLVSIIIIGIDISKIYGSVGQALRHSSFQVTSVITTTGFSTTDYNYWSPLCRSIILMLMITGCCAGSTGGGVKLSRVLILFKASKIEIMKILHPKSIKVLTINGKKVSEDLVLRTSMLFFIYLVVLVGATVITTLNGKDLISSLTGVLSMLSNVGPGLGSVGPMGNFAEFSVVSKIVFSFCMIIGRLEFYPVLVLLSPSLWKRG